MTEEGSFVVPFEQGNKIDALDRISETQAKSFRDGQYKIMVLKKGMRLWRFVSRKGSVFSDFWIDSDTMTMLMKSLQQFERHDIDFKVDYLRSNLAILEYWKQEDWFKNNVVNGLTHRLRIELKSDVVAYVGKTGSQKLFIEYKSKQEKHNKSKTGKNKENPRSEKTVNLQDLDTKAVEHRIGGYLQYVIPRFNPRTLKIKPEDNEYASVTYNHRI